MSKIEEYFENLAKNGVILQAPANYDAMTLKIYIDHLEAENKILRDSLNNTKHDIYKECYEWIKDNLDWDEEGIVKRFYEHFMDDTSKDSW